MWPSRLGFAPVAWLPLGAKRAGADQTLVPGRALGRSVGVTVVPTSSPAGPLREVGGSGLKQRGLLGLSSERVPSPGAAWCSTRTPAAPLWAWPPPPGCVPSAF